MVCLRLVNKNNNNIVFYLILNASVYSLITIYFFLRKRDCSIGIFILLLYSLSAWASVSFFTHPLFEYSLHNSKITLEPFIYLFIVLMLFIYPVIKFKNDSISTITIPPYKKFIPLINIIFIVSAVSIIINFSLMVKGLSGDIAANRNIIMDSGYKSSGNPILTTISRVSNSLRDISIMLFFFMLCFYPKKKVVLFFLGVCAFATPLIASFANSARTTIILIAISFIANTLLFRKFLPKKTLKYLKISSFVLVGILLIPFVLISVSRFGNNDFFSMDFFLIKYPGESFINFNGILYNDLKTTSDGASNFPLFRRFFFLDYQKSIADYRNVWGPKLGVPVHIFYQFIGGLYMDFGRQLTVVIAIIVFFIEKHFIKFSKVLNFNVLILLTLFIPIYTEGIFYFTFGNEPGNLKIILTIILFIYFKGAFPIRKLQSINGKKTY